MGCAVGPEAKSELSREERKMQQQLELFKKMEAATQKDEAGGGGRGGKANASEKTAGQRVGAAKERKTADVDREEVSGASSDEEEGKQGRMRMGKGSKSRREDARRVSRVKGRHGSGNKSEAPDLEAHFSDGAWYDIVLRTADSSSNRFLVQVRFDHQPRPCARIHAARFQILRGRRRTRGPAPSYRAASWQGTPVCMFAASLKCFSFSICLFHQARDFPDEEEWVEADKIRLQSQPFEDLPKVGCRDI